MQIKLKTTVNTQVEVDKELPFDVDDIISYEENGEVMVSKVVLVTIESPEKIRIKDSNGYSFRAFFAYDLNNMNDSRNTGFKLVNRTKNFPK